MPFGNDCEFENFDACVAANQDKENPEAFCAALQEETETTCARDREERRQDVRLRAELNGNKLVGYASVYNQVGRISNGNLERIAPGAFSKVLNDSNTDVLALMHHDKQKVLGRQSSGTVRLRENPDGLYFEIDLPDTSYANDLKNLVARGDIKGMSFGYEPKHSEWGRLRDGRYVETITEIARMQDISPTSTPTWSGTSVQLRSNDIMSDREYRIRNQPKEGKEMSPPIMQEKRATVEDINLRMRSIVEEAGENNLTDEQMTEYENLENQLAATRRTDAIRERQQNYEKPQKETMQLAVTPQDDTLERAFEHYMRTGIANADLMQLRAQSVGTGTEGGFTVPEVFRQRLEDRVVEFGGLAAEVETISTTGGEPMRWPTLDDTANTGEVVAENTAPSTSGADLVFGEKTLGAFRYIAPGAGNLPLRVSVELLQDSAFDVQGLVTRKLGERIARQQSDHWVSGAGTTEPTGIATGATQTQDFTLPLAATTTPDELIDAMLQVDPFYRRQAIWVISDHAWGQLRKLKDADNRPLLQPAGDSSLANSPAGFIEGRRVVIDSSFDDLVDPGLGTTNTWGVFGDLTTAYVLRRVRDLQLVVNPFTRANEGQVEFTLWARADGNVQNEFAYVALQKVGT